MHKVKLLVLLLSLALDYSLAYAGPNFVIMGPPGAGKGSFAQLMREYNYTPICVGDRLKEHIRNKTEIGMQIKPIVERGDFVDVKIGNNILREDLQSCLKSGSNFIIDGFVRNHQSFSYLDEILREFNATDNVIFLVFSHNEEASIKRILGRSICNKCGEIYNKHSKKPSLDRICDQCGHRLDIRIDDKDKKIIQRRFKRYLTESLPIIKEIESKYKVIRIDSSKEQAELKDFYRKLAQK